MAIEERSRLSELKGTGIISLSTENNDGAVPAQEIIWNQQGEPAKTKRDLGRVTLDQAAVQLLAAEQGAKPEA